MTYLEYKNRIILIHHFKYKFMICIFYLEKFDGILLTFNILIKETRISRYLKIV